MKGTKSVLLAGLAIAGVGVFRLAQAERHQRQRNILATIQMHQEWLRHLEDDPETRDWWAPEGKDAMDAHAYARVLHANQLFCALSARHKVGLLDASALRVQARWLMSRSIGRDYWSSAGPLRQGPRPATGSTAASIGSWTTSTPSTRRATPSSETSRLRC
ncbi:DUF6082 family protein [Streptomyces sp. NPDC059575]|uniref:DUF6082 family protein n=1 Tax=Streptomyces sp. NPDC059575 TaxID=3346872 RepID=UPI00369FF37C